MADDPTSWGAKPVDDGPAAWGATPVSDEHDATVGSVAKQGALGVGRGIAGIAGNLYDAVTGRRAAAAVGSTATTPEEFEKGLPTPAAESLRTGLGMEGANSPKNFPERLASGVGQALPTAPLLGMSAPANLALAGASGASGTLAREALPEDSPEWLKTGVEMVGGALPLGITSSIARRAGRVAPPSVDELHDAATQNYTNARGLGVEFPVGLSHRLATDISSDLIGDGFRAHNQPGTFRTIEELRTPAGATATIDDIDSVRKALGKLGKSADGAEREAARRAIDVIDDHMANLTSADAVNNGHFIPRLREEMQAARDNWGAFRRRETLDDLVDRANLNSKSHQVDNYNGQLKTQFKRLLLNKNMQRGFSREELDAVRQVVEGTPSGNLARQIGRFAPKGPVSTSAAIYLIKMLSGDLSGLALGAGAAGTLGARKLGTMSTERGVSNTMDMVSRRSALGRQTPQSTYSGPIRGGLPYLAGTEVSHKRGGAVKKALRMASKH